MGVNLHQNGDGSASFIDDLTGYALLQLGGPESGTVTAGTASSAPRYGGAQTLKLPIGGGTDTGGGILSWQNPYPYELLVNEIMLRVNTSAAAACTIAAGCTTTGTSLSNNLLDALDVHTATGLFDNYTDKGSNGKTRQVLPQGGFLTISTSAGASTGLAGAAFLSFIIP
jgi:hypothetical protein